MVEKNNGVILSREEQELLEEYGREARDGLVARIRAGEPAAYVLGRKYFYRNYFYINGDCLIPRPDTERVVEEVVSQLPASGRLADLCTGSGCIALSVLDERRDASAYACDISPGALAAARKNADLLGLSDRIAFGERDVLEFRPAPDEKYDVIVSNPPYLRTDEIASYPDLAAEPRSALDGGADGLDFYRRILELYALSLNENGKFVFEIGFEQADQIGNIAKKHGFSCVIKKDYGGNDRVAILKKSIV